MIVVTSFHWRPYSFDDDIPTDLRYSIPDGRFYWLPFCSIPPHSTIHLWRRPGGSMGHSTTFHSFLHSVHSDSVNVWFPLPFFYIPHFLTWVMGLVTSHGFYHLFDLCLLTWSLFSIDGGGDTFLGSIQMEDHSFSDFCCCLSHSIYKWFCSCLPFLCSYHSFYVCPFHWTCCGIWLFIVHYKLYLIHCSTGDYHCSLIYLYYYIVWRACSFATTMTTCYIWPFLPFILHIHYREGHYVHLMPTDYHYHYRLYHFISSTFVFISSHLLTTWFHFTYGPYHFYTFPADTYRSTTYLYDFRRIPFVLLGDLSTTHSILHSYRYGHSSTDYHSFYRYDTNTIHFIVCYYHFFSTFVSTDHFYSDTFLHSFHSTIPWYVGLHTYVSFLLTCDFYLHSFWCHLPTIPFVWTDWILPFLH